MGRRKFTCLCAKINFAVRLTIQNPDDTIRPLTLRLHFIPLSVHAPIV